MKQSKMETSHIQRTFSVALKKKIVEEYEQKKRGVAEITREYDVSATSVYHWIEQYAKQYHKRVSQVVELESEEQKSAELRVRVGELERIVGQKQMEIDLLEKTIEMAEAEYGFGIKKNIYSEHLGGSTWVVPLGWFHLGGSKSIEGSIVGR